MVLPRARTVAAVVADVDPCIPSPFSAPLSTRARINAATMSNTTTAIPIDIRHFVAELMIGFPSIENRGKTVRSTPRADSATTPSQRDSAPRAKDQRRPLDRPTSRVPFTNLVSSETQL